MYPGAGLGPEPATAGEAGAAVGVPGVDGADEEEVSLPEPLPSAAAAVVASESESDSVVMRESTSIASLCLLGLAGLEIPTYAPAPGLRGAGRRGHNRQSP